MSKEIHLIVVGKLKDPHLEKIEDNYRKRLSQPQLQLHEVKACAERTEEEAKLILQKIQDIAKDSPRYIVILDEKGKSFTSQNFSQWLYQILQLERGKLFLVIGGAEGFHQKVYEKSHEMIALSPLTLPHKLARIFLIEQLYRAQSIHLKHPYHH